MRAQACEAACSASVGGELRQLDGRGTAAAGDNQLPTKQPGHFVCRNTHTV